MVVSTPLSPTPTVLSHLPLWSCSVLEGWCWEPGVSPAPSRDLACADESGRCERKVSDDSSGEDTRVDAADAYEIDKDRASTFRSAMMRASYMSINRVDVPHTVKEVARFMAEQNEGAWIMLKRLVRYLVGHGRVVEVISEQWYVKAPRVGTDCDYAGFVLTMKSTTCAHLFHGVILIKAGSWKFECS